MNAENFTNDPTLPPQRIAVVGSGISGASAAWALSQQHDVTLFESESRFGGHTATVEVDYDGVRIAVDTGFIVYNTLNYPLLTALFDHLDIETKASDMSFSLSLDEGGLEWSGKSLSAVFAQRRNMLRPSFLWMLREILRFNRTCVADRNAGVTAGKTIGEYLELKRFSRGFIDNYLIPMSAAIWSTPRIRMMDFPASTFIDFFENHRLISADRPTWRTVAGGSKTYLPKLLGALGDKAHTNAPVRAIVRDEDGVTITVEGQQPEQFDHVVIATHTDQARAILMNQSHAERAILNAIDYQPNRVVLHRDPALMPKNRKCWAAWNYLRTSSEGPDSDVSLTYWMNCLQGIDERYPLFVSLNPQKEPAPEMVFGEWSFSHPLFDQGSIKAQNLLARVQGTNRTWFAGAWTGYGFHEDGLRSGVDVARSFHCLPPFLDPGASRIIAAAESLV